MHANCKSLLTCSIFSDCKLFVVRKIPIDPQASYLMNSRTLSLSIPEVINWQVVPCSPTVIENSFMHSGDLSLMMISLKYTNMVWCLHVVMASQGGCFLGFFPIQLTTLKSKCSGYFRLYPIYNSCRVLITNIRNLGGCPCPDASFQRTGCRMWQPRTTCWSAACYHIMIPQISMQKSCQHAA